MRTDIVRSCPSSQTEVDVFQGDWYYNLPLPDTVSGPNDFEVSDPLWKYAQSLLGNFDQYNILELGPNEAEITYCLSKLKPKSLVSIEARRHNFLKCLVVKNLFGLSCRFRLGNFVEYLKDSPQHFDLIVAAGVLYHMVHPAELIELMCRHGDRIVLATHYYDRQRLLASRERFAALRASGQYEVPWTLADEGQGDEIKHNGFRCKYYRHVYMDGKEELLDSHFKIGSGGVEDFANFMTRDDIVGCLSAFGHEVLHENNDIENPRGPFLTLITRRHGMRVPNYSKPGWLQSLLSRSR